jgi:hypothetical protein
LLKPDEHEPNESGVDNKELRSLFQTMRAADAQRAPSFTQSLRPMPYRDRLGYLRTLMGTVAAVAAVILVVAGVNVLRQRGDAPPVAQHPVPVTQPVFQPQPLQPQPPVIVAAAPQTKPPVTRPMKAVKKPTPSISEWKSPTEALLKTPGDDLRTTLPKIGFTQSKPSSSE